MERGNIFLFFGAEGCGKSTQAKFLSQELALPYVSSGELLRVEKEEGSKVGLLFRNKEGAYLSDELIIPFVLQVLAKQKYRRGFILDGFPRNLKQLRALEDFLSKQGLSIKKALYLTLPLKETVRRLVARGREDDTPEKIKLRLEAYKQNSAELIRYLRDKRILTEVENTKTPEVVFEEVRRVIYG